MVLFPSGSFSTLVHFHEINKYSRLYIYVACCNQHEEQEKGVLHCATCQNRRKNRMVT